jgi:ubiquinone/menaquinone biosynthesis C-methylase UbiE
MRIAEKILYHLAMRWPSPIKSQIEKLGDTDNIEHEYRYAILQQYDSKVIKGLPYGIRDKEILEIGCGHGGICLFMAMNGAKKVVGIDLNTFHLEIAKTIKKRVENDMGIKNLPIEFMEMNAYEMTFEENSFDIVYADFAFEHFMEPEKVMQESYRLLKKGGKLVVPGFLSIWSKYALHLKHGLKMPWANLFFSEQTICNVMVRLAEEQPYLKNIYPGVLNQPKKVRDLRKYGDLNEITYYSFKQMAIRTGFDIESFHVVSTSKYIGAILRRIPLLKNSILVDILSTEAGSVLVKK